MDFVYDKFENGVGKNIEKCVEGRYLSGCYDVEIESND